MANKLKWPGVILALLSIPLAVKLLTPSKPDNPPASPIVPSDQPYIPGWHLSFEEFAAWTEKINDQAEKRLTTVSITQEEFNQKLQTELLPALKTMLDPSNNQVEVLLGSEHSRPHWKDFTMDGGRGLPVVHRYRLNVSKDPQTPDIRRMALITFLDYNMARQRFEIINANDGVVNDAFRLLVETEPKTSGPGRGFIGASFQARVENGEIVDIRPITYYTAQGEVAQANPHGKVMPDELRPSHCIQCHGREEDQFFRTNFELKRHHHQDKDALTKFIGYLAGNKVPKKQLETLTTMLKNPTQNRQVLIPAGLCDCVRQSYESNQKKP